VLYAFFSPIYRDGRELDPYQPWFSYLPASAGVPEVSSFAFPFLSTFSFSLCFKGSFQGFPPTP